MSTESIVQVRGSGETRQDAKAQMAEYLAQQPAAKQTFHRWMQALEIAGLALVAGALALALYVSINHTAFPGTAIAAAWFALPASVAPMIVLVGLHTIVLRASVPSLLPGKGQEFVTGSRAVGSGWGLVVTAVAAGAFWGALAWAAWSFNVAMIGVYVRILGTALAVVIPVSIVLGLASGLYRQFVRTR